MHSFKVLLLFNNVKILVMKKKILILLSFLTPVLLVLFFSLQPVSDAKANVKLEYRFESKTCFNQDGQEWTACRCARKEGHDCDKPTGWYFCGG